MTGWLLRIGTFGVATIDPLHPPEPSAEGVGIIISWLGFMIEVTVARHGPACRKGRQAEPGAIAPAEACAPIFSAHPATMTVIEERAFEECAAKAAAAKVIAQLDAGERRPLP